MAEFDPNYTRLKTLLMLVIVMFCIYSAELVFFGTGQEKLDDLTEPYQEGEDIPIPENIGIFDSIVKIGSYILSFFTLIFQILTFTLPTIPLWMTYIFAPISIIMIIICVYIIADILYAIVKALPLT